MESERKSYKINFTNKNFHVDFGDFGIISHYIYIFRKNKPWRRERAKKNDYEKSSIRA